MNNPTVLITGVSGGIGFAAARQFAASGADLILHVHHNVSAAEELRQMVLGRGGQADIVSADFAQDDGAERFFQNVCSITDSVDVLVNAAGLDLMAPAISALPFEQKLRFLLQTDVFSPIHLSRRFGNQMKDRGSGTIILFGWSGTDYGWCGDTAQLYGTAKGALTGFCRSLSEDLSPGVLVRCLSLGWIKTRWGSTLSEEISQRYAVDSRKKRWGTPEEVAAVIEFLTKKESAYIDGIGLRVDGEKRSVHES